MLNEVLTKLSRSALPRDKKRMGKTYPQAFKGAKLVDWLIETDFARTRAEAVAIGQRLLDSQLIWELADSAEFEDSANFIYSITTKEGLEKTPGAKAQLKTGMTLARSAAGLPSLLLLTACLRVRCGV